MAKTKLDMSLGNPLHPFRSAARHAFAQAAKDLNVYRFMKQGLSDPEIRRTYEAISDHFTARGIQPPDWSGLPFSHFTMTGGGTTEAYNLVIRLLADDVREENRSRSRNIKPAILMPVPTYGFFTNPAMREGIEVISINRDMETGQITAQQLKDAILKADADGFRIVAYFDSNPNNPLGTIRNEAQTRELADVFLAARRFYQKKDDDALKAWQETQAPIKTKMFDKEYEIKPGHVWNGPASRIRIIDDMVYDGLEYGDRKAFAFAQIPEIYKDTFTLAGPSKAGLVSVRGGIVIGHDRDITSIEKMRMENNYFPPRPTLAAMEAFYSMKEPFKAAREHHMARLNRDHRMRGLFMKALINGIDTVDEATADDKKKIISTYARLEGCSRKDAIDALRKDIPGIRVVSRPEAGFFHMIDFSALHGHTYPAPNGGWDKPFKDNYSMIGLLDYQNIGSCTAAWMGIKDNELMTRVTFALPFEDILEYTKRLRRVVAMTKPPAPAKENAPAGSCCTAAPTL